MTWLLMCLAIRGRKLKISLVFITQTYFAVPKDVRLNFTLYFIMKVPIKQEFQQGVFKNLSDIFFYESLQKIYCKVIFFLEINTTPASPTLLHFGKNHLERI